jgi:acyl-[acyl-carrier-protein]-phospholipid O-acyltransferase/long-chain-fatty-acid--[acyl-carrier-protein] ligase
MSSSPIPALYRDRSFWGIAVTQFLGAFNDNVFKQLVLLFCVNLAVEDRSQNAQGTAMLVFSAPFVLLSGFCGFLADRYSKRSIVVLSKVLEIVVMLLGLAAFLSGQLWALFVVLFLMGAQSALFGPAKYGILPELFEDQDLPRANGVLLMTTFTAIILGVAIAGQLMESFRSALWVSSSVCVGIAVVGTLTSLLIRATDVAHPGLPFDLSALAIPAETCRLLLGQRPLLLALAVTSLFWCVGGVYQQAINDLGILQLQIGEATTGKLGACAALGIAVGCMVSGRLSHGRFNARLVRIGLWGMVLTLCGLAIPGWNGRASLLGVGGAATALVLLGGFAGLFAVPLQVYLQVKAPREQKGRIIGTTNLVNWIGIAISGVYYHGWNLVFASRQWPPSLMFAAAAALLAPVALFYRPRDESLDRVELACETARPEAAGASLSG